MTDHPAEAPCCQATRAEARRLTVAEYAATWQPILAEAVERGYQRGYDDALEGKPRRYEPRQ